MLIMNKIQAFSIFFAFFYCSCAQNSKYQVDSSTKACDDFFTHVNKKWVETTPIPPDRGRISTFDLLNIVNEERLIELLEKNPGITHEEKLIRNYYDLAINEQKVGEDALEFIKEQWKRFDQVKSAKELRELLFQMDRETGFNPLYGFGVSNDLKDSKTNILQFFEIQLSLPTTDYYDQQKKTMQPIRELFVKVVDDVAKELGMPKVFEGEKLLKLETKIAKHLLTRIQAREYSKRYHPYTVDELDKKYPKLYFKQLMSIFKINPKKISIADPKYYDFLEDSFTKIPLEQWIPWLKWMFISKVNFMLPEKIRLIAFELYGKTLSGRKQESNLKKRIQAQIDNYFQDPFSNMYAQKYFPKEDKQIIENYIEKMRLAFAKRISQLNWMDSQTKEMALKKLKKFTYKIGFPNQYRDYSSLLPNIKEVEMKSLPEYITHILHFAVNESIKEIDQPVKKWKWNMGSFEVNAYYNPTMNEIVFPAAILQAPFFDHSYSIGENLGGIGAVIGHEFSHGFDDQGSKFDGDGNSSLWWTPGDIKDFQELTKKLVEQYNKYEVDKDLFVKGELTLGENIADLAGLMMALETLKVISNEENWSQKKYDEELQKFFYNFAYMWRNKNTTEYQKALVEKYPHAPGKFRVNGTLANIKDFDDIFHCHKNGSQKNYLHLW